MATRKRTTKTTGRKTARSAAVRGAPRSGTAGRSAPALAAARRGVARSGPAQRGALTPPATARRPSGEAERLRALKLQLQIAQDKLLLIDPNRLDVVAHAAWSNEIFELARAINALRNVQVEQLPTDFAVELSDIESATQDLADDLEELEDAADVIDAVAGELRVIARITTLVA